jgi:NodT family efflux transporter outer membrane factor (OMF) lipoprotein
MSSSNKFARHARLAALLSAVVLPACAAVGPNYQPPQSPTTAGYAMTGDAKPRQPQLSATTSPAGEWWQAFGSSQLDTVIRQALVDSPTIASADAALDQARQAVVSARDARGLQGGFNAAATETRVNAAAYGFAGFPSPTISQYSIGANVIYDLDLFGGKRRQQESAEASAQAESHRAAAAYLSLTGNVAMQAVQIAAVRAQIAAAEAIIDDDQRSLDLALRAIKAGSSAPADAVGVRAQLAQDRAALPDLNQQLAVARHALALLVGHAPADWAAPDFDLAGFTVQDSIPLELPSELAHRRPDILAAEEDVHAATANVGVQAAQLYPDVKLGAGLTQTALTPDKLFSYDFSGWNFGPSITAPIFGRAALKANQRAAEAQARGALATYKQTVLKAFVQVADALQAISNDEQSATALNDAMQLAERDLTDTRFAFEKGGGDLIAINQAQRRLSETRRAYAEAQGRRVSDVVRLYVATGSDWRQTKVAAR